MAQPRSRTIQLYGHLFAGKQKEAAETFAEAMRGGFVRAVVGKMPAKRDPRLRGSLSGRSNVA